jgi:hypothetical protein
MPIYLTPYEWLVYSGSAVTLVTLLFIVRPVRQDLFRRAR